MIERRKVETVHEGFDKLLEGLKRLDALNQTRFRAGPGRPGAASLTKGQMVLVTEGVFVRAFTSFELFLEEVFILYTRGKPTKAGTPVERYISPRDGKHARDLLRSGMNYLEWNSPDVVIARAETYLNGGPIKLALSSYQSRLNTIKRVRNAIAHRSDDAWNRYQKAVATELRAPPLREMGPGEFLMQTDPAATHRHFLLSYLAVLKDVADIASG